MSIRQPTGQTLPVITVETGPMAGQTYPVSQQTLTVGRKDDNDLYLPDSRVSSHHALLERRADGLYIIDQGSTNGTLVNNQPIGAPTRLKSGDRVTLGETTLSVSLPDIPPSRKATTVEDPKPEGIPSLTALSGPLQGKTFILTSKQTSLGREDDNTIVLSDDRLSRHHARIDYHDGGIWVVDLQSSNGTFVNDNRVTEPVRLRPGDRVRLGSTVFDVFAPDVGRPARGGGTVKQPAAPPRDATTILPKEEIGVEAHGYLSMISGSLTGEVFTLYQDITIIGRSEACTISLRDEGISQHHAQLQLHNDAMWVIDQGSSNGTLVNGRRISQPHLLRRGDRIKTGVAEFEFATSRRAAEKVFEKGKASTSQLLKWGLIIGAPLTALVLVLLIVVVGLAGRSANQGLSEEEVNEIARSVVESEGLSEEDLDRIAQELAEESDDQPAPSGAEEEHRLTASDLDQISRSVVMVGAARNANRPQDLMWGGSGTIISPDGKILTNCHVACDAPNIIIFMTDDVEHAPVPRYIAEVAYSGKPLDLDLVVVQIIADVDGNPIASDSLNLPYIEVADSDSVKAGDALTIFGYPEAGGETITITFGTASGFVSAEFAGRDRRVFVKTDARISSGNSGGAAVNNAGQLIGVPTAVSVDERTMEGVPIILPVNLVTLIME